MKTRDGRNVTIYRRASAGVYTHGWIEGDEHPSWWDRFGEYCGPVLGRNIDKDLDGDIPPLATYEERYFNEFP